MPNIIIGSRGSKLALWQAHWIKNKIQKAHPGLDVEIEIIKTTGDRMTDVSLAKIGGKGVFTKEIEDALLERRIDLAVHSLKDLPTTLPDGLHIAAITEREDVRDALLVNDILKGKVNSIKDLPEGSRVGTSSLRRRAQLLYHRPDLQITDLRGNIDTRLRKLDAGGYDAIVLAAAGLIRLGFSNRITAYIEIDEMLTAVGQGALGIETRIDDQRTNLLLDVLNHWPTRHSAEAERATLRELGGGCAVPIAALGRVKKENRNGKKGGKLTLDALVCDVEGRYMIRRQLSGPMFQAEEIGSLLAQELITHGARELLEQTSSESNIQPPPLGEPVEPFTALSVESSVESSGEPSVESPNEIQIEELASDPVSTATPAIEEVPTAPDSQTPLNNCRIIITRSIKQSEELTKALEDFGAEVIACPTIEIREPSSWEQMDLALKHLSWYDWLAFTSANGVEYFLRRLDELGHGRAELMSHLVCAVGSRTAERLMRENISVDLTPDRFTAEALVEEFSKSFGIRQRLRGARMLLPASHTTRDVIRPALEKIGVYVEVVEAYRTVMPNVSRAEVNGLIRSANAAYIIFTSPSTVSNLAALLETDHLAPYLTATRVACIGPVTADAARVHGLEVHIQPEEHTGQAIVSALVTDRRERGSGRAGERESGGARERGSGRARERKSGRS
jgi:hydroxymethylbilane synthase